MTATRWRGQIPNAILVVTLTLTVLVTYFVVRTTRARDELRFETTAEEIRHRIEIRLNTYIEVLRAGVALFAASANVSREEFHEFVQRLRLPERYPGIQGIGFAQRVRRERVAGQAPRGGDLQVGGIRVWPPGERDDYTSILYLEPMDRRNRQALGYDMFTEPVRRAAMEQARDTGEPAASAKVTLVQEIDPDAVQPGFLIYVPVYRNAAPVSTVEERRANLAGFVYSPFRVEDLLNSILAEEGPIPLGIRVYDDTAPRAAALMYTGGAQLADDEAELHRTFPLTIAGHTWTIEFLGREHLEGGSPAWLAPITFLGGLLLSFGLFRVTLVLSRAREGAERHAAELRASEEALRESEMRLKRLVVLEREARDAAEAADRAKDEFLATLSHELRTPLNAMLGWITMLRAGSVREDRRETALEVIERNARTQARLIEDLLDISRIITGKVRLDLHPVQIGPIVRAALETLRPGAVAKGVRLHASIDPALGPVMGDAARLQQIAWNLLSNAIKFTPAGGDVHLEIAGKDDEIELSVRDTGLGIAPDFLPHVFERFRQADSSTTRPHSGVGLGLSIVRHLVELHGGRVSAYSEGPNRGALFVVRLPLARRAQLQPGAPREHGAVAVDGLHVLVVEDDADTREMLAAALAASGARVTTAGSADEALAVLQDRGADVLVSDIGMPEVDGYMLMRRVRRLPGGAARIPAIALTAYARPEDQRLAAEAGYQVHLAKPVELPALRAALASLARRATT